MPDLAALLSPRSVAVVGAAPDRTILRGRTLKVMLRHPYGGRIYPVSRSHASVQGLKAYRSIAELPERVDLAVLIIPAAAVPEALECCGEAGVRAALVLASGFAEDGGEAGAALQARISGLARRFDMAVCGPNSEGFANLQSALCPTFSPALDELAVPLVPEWRTSGHAAVVSQSGGIGFSFFDRGRPKEVPFSYVVTTGNEACLDAFDVVEYLLDEGRTEVFVLFLESVRNADTFRRVAAKALAAGKPLIVAKIGQSDAGRRAAASHTAALAGEHEAYRAMFRRYGLIEGADSEEMVDLAAAFSLWRDRLPAGTRVGIATASGGGGGWMADACAAAGLQVPELEPEARARIDVHLPPYGTSQNPVDGTAQAIRTIGYSELARLTGASERVDSVIVVTSARSAEVFERERESLYRLARETRKPVLMWSYTLPGAESLRMLSEAGYPVITSMRNCARAVAAMAEYRALRERFLLAQDIVPSRNEARRARGAGRLAAAGPVLCECEAAPLLAEYGVRFAEGRLVSSADEAIAAAAELAGAVALKVQSPDLLHKTEAGAVALGAKGSEAVALAYETVVAGVRRCNPDAKVRGVLVQAMAPPGLEMIVGVKRDPVFGPMLLVGPGGVHAEVLRDVALAPLPLSADGARELLGQLRGRALLDGQRGAPASDVDALIELMLALAAFAEDHGDRIEEIDLNPVIVHAARRGVTAVDALIVNRRVAGTEVLERGGGGV
jgi:acyl-CoA synthetase (NDP forming)